MSELVEENHGVRFFDGSAYPVERIARFLGEGLLQGRFAMALAGREHWQELTRVLGVLGVDCTERVETGQLVVEEAGALATAFARDGKAEKSAFEALIATRVRSGTARFGRGRAYGEVVDVLLSRGDVDSCLRLEAFWNELLSEMPLELWCGYTLDHFASVGSSSAFVRVCDAHQRVECEAAQTHDPGRMAAELWQSRTQLGLEAAQRKSAERDLAHAYEDLSRAYDVTRRACERAELTSRMKDEFMARLGHELRNPLSPILVATELMARRAPDAFVAERRVIERQARHLTRLIDDLQDMARITTGRVELNRQLLELGRVVADAVEIARPLIVERGHELDVDVTETGLSVEGDADRLTQVVANLLINAAKYTPPHGRIRVEAACTSHNVTLSVSDNGAGLEREHLLHIFELFVQGPEPRTRQGGGLGLGLAIAHNLVELHDGRLRAFSDGPGRGSTFEIELPLVRPSSLPLADDARSRARTSRALDVLVIDDNGDLAALFAESLREVGHRVEVALDGRAALKIAESFWPDIALLDLGLPDIDGCELALRLKARLAERELKLVAISGYGQDADRQRTRAAGFDLHLVKPVPLAELEGAIATLFAQPCVA